MLCFVFLVRKLLGRNLFGAYSLLDPPQLAVCIKILYNSTKSDLSSYWFGAFSGLELWLLQSLFRFPPLQNNYTTYSRANISFAFLVSNAFNCGAFTGIQLSIGCKTMQTSSENLSKCQRPCSQGRTICQKEFSGYLHLFSTIMQKTLFILIIWLLQSQFIWIYNVYKT